MWTVIAFWAVTAAVILADFQWRRRRDARSADLMEQLTAGDSITPDSLPELTRLEFQDLVSAGLPPPVEMALAQDLRAHEGDESLVAVATGAAHASPDRRIQALRILVSGRHPQVHGVLAAALRDPQQDVAAVALRLLRELDDERAATTLVDALADGAYAASRIAAALDRMTAERTGSLGVLLQHSSASVRFWGLLLAGRTGAAEWRAEIRSLVTDREPMVRRAAVEALGRLGSPDDRPLLLARFYDPSAMVRVHAARSATAFADASVADGLVMLLSDREWIVRAAARDSLRVMGDAATPAVMRTLWRGDAFAANNAAEVLFLTGATLRLIDGLLRDPMNEDRRRLIERLLFASGPHIVRAVYDQMDSTHQSTLQRLLGQAPATPARVRNR